MRLLDGPIKIRIEAAGSAELAARIARVGILVVSEGEEADLVATAPPRRSDKATSRRKRLSARELEILGYLADGWSNAEIASVLGIGVRTVRFHLESLYSKLGTNRRGEAVREGVRLGLVSFDA